MPGEEGRQVCSICTLIIQPSVPPCSLPALYQGLASVVGDPVFGVGQVAAATTQRTGGFYRGVPTTACALLLSPLLALLRLLVRSSSSVLREVRQTFGYELNRDGFPESLPTTISQEPEGAL